MQNRIYRCTAAVISRYLMEYSQYVLWGAISCGRVHMLRRNWVLSLFVLALAFTPVVCDVAVTAYLRPAIDPIDGCVLYANISSSAYNILAVLGYTGWIASEIIVVGVTLSATRYHRTLQGAFGHERLSISAVLFRDALIAHGPECRVIAVLNVAQLAVNVISMSHSGVGIDRAGSILSFVTPLTSILLTRLFFNLQDTAHPQSYSLDTTSRTQANFPNRATDLEARFRRPVHDEEIGRTEKCSTLDSERDGTACT
ncbi:hypothetical protein C8Q77DRAFT_1129873 [Trametes polyzona]|nr:hypothetical protein C8Q77DRAFT_1129873 [Trametes polyzona]